MKAWTRFRNARARFYKDESGAVMVIAAFALVVFLTVASLVTDLGMRYYQKSRLQNAMDAAALASVTCLPDKARAKTVALEYVQKNGFSTDDVVIEFPQEGIIRVRDTYECQTLFSGFFAGDKMHIEAHAAAKYVKKNMSIDFDYLMFHGAKTTFNLNGDIREVAGAVFANGNIRVGTNDAAAIDTIVSAEGIVFANNMARPNVVEHAAEQDMPDWDEMIMSIAPVVEKAQFTDPHAHLSPNASYAYTYNGDTNLQSIIAYAPGSVICHGSLTTGYNNTALLYVRGNLYVEGDFKPQCPVYVTGDLYVGGELAPAWGMSVSVGGNAYVAGKASFAGSATIGGELYTGGDLTLSSGNGTGYSFGSIHCMGNFDSMTAWGAQVTVKNTTVVYGKLALGGGGRNILKNDVYVWGNNCNATNDVCFVNGYMNLNGDVWCGKGKVAFGGNGDCVIHGFIYSKGSIETRSGGDISLNGCMIAEGDINIGGASHTYNDDGATLSLYSRKGNVNLGSQGSALNMWGIVYAPKGDIKISTNGLHMYGSLVANTITCNIGSGFYIGKNDRTLPFAKAVRAAALVE